MTSCKKDETSETTQKHKEKSSDKNEVVLQVNEISDSNEASFRELESASDH